MERSSLYDNYELPDIAPSPVDRVFHRPKRRDYKRAEQSQTQESLLKWTKTNEEELRSRMKPWRFIYECWPWEVLSITLSVVATAAIVIAVSNYNHKPPPDLPYGITFNAIVSLLSTVAKAPMLAVVSTCIGHLKWRWFRIPHKIEDFELFDKASRGPYGAFSLIFRGHLISLASLGAIITLLSLFVDPFVQQIITYPLLSITTGGDGATVPRAQIYDAGVYMDSLAGGVQQGPEFGMKAAIYKGIFTSSNPSDVTPVCPTGNCTFPLFDTLAFCSKCSNFTANTTLSKHTTGNGGCGNMLDMYVQNYTYTLPGSTDVTITACYSGSANTDLAQGIAMRSSVDVPRDMSSSTLGISNPIVSLALLQFPAVEAEHYKGNYNNQTPQAWECALYYCLHTYNTTVINNQAKTQLVSTWHNETGTPIPTSNIEATPDGILRRPENPMDFGAIRANSTFWIPAATVATLAEYMNHTLSGEMLTSSSEVESGTFTNDVMQALNITTDIGGLMENLAISMTNYLRQTNSNGAESVGIGSAHTLEVHVRVRWAWLALSGALILLSIGLLIATIILSARTSSPVWKSTSLETLFHGLDDNTGATGWAAGISSVAKTATTETKVVLGQSANGDLKLVRPTSTTS